MRPQQILCLGVLLVVFVRQGLFAQCGQATQKPAVSTVASHSPTPKIAKRNSKDRVLVTGVLGCVSSPVRIMVSSWVMSCFLFDRVEPVYPAETENSKERLTLRVVVGKDGKVLYARKITGPDNLEPAAVEAVRKWKYRPYMLNGEPIEVDTTVDLPTVDLPAESCSKVLPVPLFGTRPLPSWLFNTRPVMPVLATQGTQK